MNPVVDPDLRDQMLHLLTLGIVVLAGIYLISLSAAAFLAPQRASRFLLSFAATAPAHYLELMLRGIAGSAFVLQAPRMHFAGAFRLFGWVLLISTAALAALPWRWHRGFAQRAVPALINRLWLVGVVSLVLGGLVLTAALA